MSNDAVRRLEERVARLEAELQRVKAQLAKGPDAEQPWWEKIAGRHEGSKAFGEIVRLGRQIRRADGRDAGQRNARAAARTPRKARRTPKRKG